VRNRTKKEQTQQRGERTAIEAAKEDWGNRKRKATKNRAASRMKKPEGEGTKIL